MNISLVVWRDDKNDIIRLQHSSGWRISEHKSFSERGRAVIRYCRATRRVHQMTGHVTIAQQVLQTVEDIPRALLRSVVSCAVQTEGQLTARQELFDEVFVVIDLLFNGLLLLFVLARLVLQPEVSHMRHWQHILYTYGVERLAELVQVTHFDV